MSRVPERVEIAPVGPRRPDGDLLRWLAEALRERLGVPVVPGEPLEAPDAWRCPESGRLDSNHVVDALIARDTAGGEEAPARWVLGVTDEDLVAPGRSFVFGEAAQGGAWAVIALARLRAGAGSADAGDLLRERALKEAVHELGHLWGLGHCATPDCVMFPSQTLADTDRKGSAMCPACGAAALDASGVDRARPSR